MMVFDTEVSLTSPVIFHFSRPLRIEGFLLATQRLH